MYAWIRELVKLGKVRSMYSWKEEEVRVDDIIILCKQSISKSSTRQESSLDIIISYENQLIK